MNGKKEGTISSKTKLVDVVSYEGLVPGETYTLAGMLYLKSTGKPLLVGGQPVISTKEFIAEERNGEVKVEFAFDSSNLAGQTIVVFENLTSRSIKVATHSDINSESQAVFMKNPFIQTGDTKKLALYGGIFGTSLAVFIWAVFPRIRKRHF